MAGDEQQRVEALQSLAQQCKALSSNNSAK
jgi:hypothetical protein